MQTSIRSTTDSTQHGDLPRTENDGGNSWKRLRSGLGLARDDDDDIYIPPLTGKPEQQWFTMQSALLTVISSRQRSAISSRPLSE